MSQTEPETVPSAPTEKTEVPAGQRARPGILRRIVDWYTCRPAREAVRRAASAGRRELELLGRAKAAFNTGNLLRQPSDPSRKSLAGAHAAALYAESLTWALWSSRPSAPRLPPDELLLRDEPVTRELGLSEERAHELSQLLASPALAVELAERSEQEQSAAATLLKRAALVAIDVHERPQRAAAGITLLAFARVALTLLALALVVAGAVALRPQRANLAAGKPWKTSSSLFDCHPEQVECGGVKTRILFHTRDEQDPWFQYDLGTKTTFSSLRIENRQDGESDRAVPLVVEVGDDGEHFRQVARRDSEFSAWSPSFPAVTARYVRLRVPRRSMLHLEEVELYR